jgi:carbamoyl-phosphate synthase large subunit
MLIDSLTNASWNRLFSIKDAMKFGIPTNTIRKITKIDPWFLNQIEQLNDTEKEMSKYTLQTLPEGMLRKAKQQGYADRQIAHILRCLESEVFKKRHELGIKRVYKMVDTCAAEFEAKTPYYYSTFEGENESVVSDKKKVIVLGSGPNRIGQGIEFDYSCVHGVLAAKECGYETIMINCNPETVSTDFDIADKLYFEPVFWEHIYDIILHEKPEGVIVQLGGQTALKLAEKLDRYGIKIIGTSYKGAGLSGRSRQFLYLAERQQHSLSAICFGNFCRRSDQNVAEIEIPAFGAPKLRVRRPEHEDRDQRAGTGIAGSRYFERSSGKQRIA